MGEAVTLTACFKLEKETKNTDRYAELPEAGKPSAAGSIYTHKWAPPEPVP
jgi:hypothetical protein